MISIDVQLPLDRAPLVVKAELAEQTTAVLGPSGAGKTSLLETIAGLRPLARGVIKLDDEVFLDSARGVAVPSHLRRIGWVPQQSALFPHLDVAGNIAFGLRGKKRGASFDEAVDMLELAPLLHRATNALSGGERQRVALARALVVEPKLLLLDEPLAALDVDLKERILPYLLRVRARTRVPMLYVTHHVGEASVIAQEAIVLRDGAIVARRTLRDASGTAQLHALDPRATFENVVAGKLRALEGEGAAELVLSGGRTITVPVTHAPGADEHAAYSVLPEDVLLSIAPLTGISARNVLEGEVSAIEVVDGDAMVVVTTESQSFRVKVTRAAERALKLTQGLRVWLVIKTHAFRRLR
jgi:molybdate transport system ATP-binding protein